MGYTVFYPTPWEFVDTDNDNIDVCLELETGETFTLVVATPDNLKSLMKKDGLPYIAPGTPFLFVEKLTEQNIGQLIDELLKQGSNLLRLYGEDVLTDIG